MHKWARWATLGLVVVAVGAGVFLVPTIWFKPWSIDHFFTRAFLEVAWRHPMLLTQIGIKEPFGLTIFSDKLDDFSPAAEDREMRELDRNLAILKSYDRSRLTPTQRLSAEIMDWFLEDQKSLDRYRLNSYPVNQLYGAQSQIPDFLINSHPLKRPSDAENYVRRVGRMGVALDQVNESVRLRESKGVVPPRFVLTEVVAEMKSFTAPPADQNELYRHFSEKADSISGLAPERRSEMKKRLAAEITNTVYPAYARLIAVCARQESLAITDDGVWKLPNGDAFYDQCLRHHTTTDMTADQIHELGLAEVARIQDEMRSILRRQGIAAGDLAAAMAHVRSDRRFYYADDDSGRAQILADYQSIIDDANRGMGKLFDLRPKLGVVVKRVPVFKEKTSPGGYYEPGAFDGSRPGVFYTNLSRVSETAKFGMRTLAYHEAIPGHHFQIGIAQDRKDLPFFRRILPFTAYQEGWGLYAERLMLEQGYQKTPYDSLGALTAELMRAARLVVDTGIHRKHWSREQAIHYMTSTTGLPEPGVVAEVERYIVAPGQACAYKVGQLKILELRDRAEQRLGAKFDLKQFHDLVLENGALPLGILEHIVDQWVETRAKAAA